MLLRLKKNIEYIRFTYIVVRIIQEDFVRKQLL